MSLKKITRALFIRNGLKIGLLAMISTGTVAAWRQGSNLDAGYLVHFTGQNLEKLGISHRLRDAITYQEEYVASYGYSTQLFNHYAGELVTWLAGSEYSADNEIVYSVRNVVTFFISLLAYWGVYQIIKNFTQSQTFSWLGVIFLSIIGTFTGNSFFNDKDIPLAAGVILLVAATVNTYLYKFDGYRSKMIVRQTWVNLCWGLILTLGTRPGFWPVILLLTVVTLLVARQTTSISMYKSLCWATLSGGLYVVISNGYLLRSPIWWFTNSLTMSTKFPFSGSVTIRSDPYAAGYRWYLAFMVLIQTPLMILLLFFALVCIVCLLMISNRKRADLHNRNFIVISSLLIALSGGLVLIATVQSTVTYDGARQFLFVYPLLATCAALASWKIFNQLDKKLIKNLTTFVVLIGICAPAVGTLQLFPYQHVYTSEWALWDDRPSDNSFDNQAVSAKETQNWINAHYQHQKIGSIPEQAFKPYVQGNSVVATSDENMRLYTQIWRPALIPDYFVHCPIVFSLTRSQFWNLRLLSYVRDCSKKAP